MAPPAITVASLALSGVSFMQTGKTLPDHALSSVSQRDCIMFRATRGEQICQVDAGALDHVTVADAGQTSPADTAWPEEINALPAPSGAVPTAKAVPVKPVMVASLDPIPVPVADDLPTLLEPPAAGETARMPVADVVAQSVGGPTSGTPNTTSAQHGFLPSLRHAERMVPETPPPMDKTTEATDTASTPRATPVAAPPSQIATRHLVVGSFRERARATTHVARLGDANLRILSTTVKGRVQYRVVAGPFPKSELAAAKRSYAALGIKGAWPITVRDQAFQLAAR